MRGQVTMYILIGVLALAFLGTTVYVVNKFFFVPPTVAQQLPDVVAYVTDCLVQTSKDALKLVGAHGGYIDLKRRNVRLSGKSVDSDALVLDEGLAVAYWWYLQSSNQCTDCKLNSALKPTEALIRNELSSYTRDRFRDCVGNFDPFVRQGYHFSTGNATVDVQFTKDDVRVKLNWPVTVSRAGAEIVLREFESVIDVPLQRLYAVADNVSLEEKNRAVLEYLLLHMIGVYSDIAPDKLPPLSGITNDPRIISWSKSLVEQQVNALIASAVPTIAYGPPLPEKNRSFEEAAFAALRVIGQDTPFDVRFHYFGWPVYFDITPTIGDRLVPDTVRTTFPMNVAPPFQSNVYEFFYDLSVPVLVEIFDKSALKGEGYSFFFALEANIRGNKPLIDFHFGDGTIGPFTAPEITPVIDIPKVNAQLCENVSEAGDMFVCPLNNKNFSDVADCLKQCSTTTIVPQNVTFNETFFCDPEQQVSGTVKLVVNDARSNSPVSDASLTYGCGKVATCLLPASTPRGVIRTKLPICYNGLMRVEKSGFQPFVGLYTAEVEKPDVLNVSLEPLRTVQVVVKRYQTDGETLSSSRTLSPGEQAVLMLDRVKEKPIEEEFQARIQIDGANVGSFDLIPGKYEVKALLIDKAGFVLPAECMQICEKYDDDGKCKIYKRVPEKSQKVSPAMLGGVVFNNNTGFFDVSAYDLDKSGKNSIEFYVVKTRTPTCVAVDDCVLKSCIGLEEMGRTEEYTKKFRKQLEPRMALR
ncbi:hypothetical protein HY490_00100 [Candidatus Woesearchaeota archaeon]|nr:hypothetical protein [Candidatus Woesearchaeota archaeon]